MKQLFYLLLISIILISCRNYPSNNDDDRLVIEKNPSKTYTFNLDFIRYRANLGRIVKKDTFYYFYHYLYFNQIVIYNEQQEKVDSISIKKYSTVNNPVMSVKFLNSDTISLRTQRDIIYLINSKTKLLKTIDVKEIQTQLNDTFLAVYNQINYSNTYQAALISHYNGKGNPYNSDQCSNLLRYFMEKDVNTKRLVFIDDVFADSLSIHHSIKQLEKSYIDSSYYVEIRYRSYLINNILIMYGVFTSNLYQVSLKSKEVEKIIPIKSKYPSPIVLHHIDLESSNEECIEGMEAYTNGFSEGLIESIYFSNYTKLYYVAVRHKKQTENDKEKRYSILSYDMDFNKIAETDLMLNPVGMWSEKGVYIKITEEHIGENQIQLKYYEFIK